MIIMNTIAVPRQTNVSENVRVSIKRLAMMNGGLARFVRELGMAYKKTWERLNRNKGDLIDGVVELALVGFDDPLRIAADAAGYEITPKIKFLRKDHPGKSVRYYELDLHHATAAVTMLVERALEDGMTEARKWEEVKSALQKLRRKMAELEARVSGDMP